MTDRPTYPKSARTADLDHIEALVVEAERAFASKPKALWSDRTYLAPKDAAVLRRVILREAGL